MELTDITADTSLDDILKSKEIENTTSTTYNSINKTISCRTQAIESCMNTEGFNSVVEGEVLLKDSAQTVLNSYEDFLQSMKSTFNGIVSAAAHREYDELGTLRTKINEALVTLGKELEGFEKDIENCDSRLEKKYYDAVTGRNRCVDKKEEYENTLLKIEARIGELNLSSTSTSGGNSEASPVVIKPTLINRIPNIELDAFDNPVNTPADFVIDANHEISIPGYGEIHTNIEGDVEFHYDGTTNCYYFAEKGVDWENYDYENSYCGVSLDNIIDSNVIN